jgi:hypothetical protein
MGAKGWDWVYLNKIILSKYGYDILMFILKVGGLVGTPTPNLRRKLHGYMDGDDVG